MTVALYEQSSDTNASGISPAVSVAPDAGTRATAVTTTRGESVEMSPGGATNQTSTDPRKYFLIHNSWSNKVLDVRENDESPGTYLIIYQLKTPFSDNQLWYNDQNGYICSKLTNFYIDTSKDGYARLKPRGEANVKQHWVYHEDDRTIRNEHERNKVLDIRWNIKWNCNKVIEYDFHGGRNQKWELRKVDI